MQRYAFIFRMKPELKEAYKKDHDEIWPDMAQAIRESGITNYSIFFHSDGTLFAYLEAENPGKAFEFIANCAVEALPLRYKFLDSPFDYFACRESKCLLL